MLHLISLNDWKAELIAEVLDMAGQIKGSPENYRNALVHKTLLMMFEKPSLRTRVSFETGMSQLGGHAIFYDMTTSPLGAGKETIHDTVKTVSRYVDIIMARLFDHAKIVEMAQLATVPVINALTDFEHPCQILADLMTVREKKHRLKGLTLAYLGDSNNNVTHSLLYGCTKMGMNIRVGCPPGEEFSPSAKVLREATATAAEKGCTVQVTRDAVEAVKGADVVYTDSWMSYHIPPHKLNERVRVFTPYQVNAELMKHAAKGAIFLNCLPALRGYEQTAEVIDGPQSVVFDEAENRLHVQKAVMLKLLSTSKK
ncbi:MAG: Ornithine carbamoyltransferase [Verrucomicrobia bacterium ADurb.Bin345]|nr:MAG: Ornithine carbamoyltransferase [Verrucomicrobia bacterium ADurb.Bin345]